MKRVRLLIVDDSAVVRNILSRELAKDPEIEVIGTAPDPYIARDKIVNLQPDVITLDVEMPRMDGITFLGKLMRHKPMPVIILSSLTPKGCETALTALELGAVDVMQKPELDLSHKLNEMLVMLADKIKEAAQTKYRFTGSKPIVKPAAPTATKMTAMIRTTDKIVAIGASTGGTEAIRQIIPLLPPSFPGTVIVQHMPEKFTKAFADSLNKQSQMEVREAADGDTVRPGLVLIARGNYHMLFRRSGARYYVQLKQGPLVCRQRPAVEVLFESVAKYAGANAIGVMLTGMGNDGAKAMVKMKEAGSFNICQNEESCVVFGMPMEAIKEGAAHKVLPLSAIPRELMVQLGAFK